MNHDITQWLKEIESLQQKVAEAMRHQAEAEASAEHWRQLYNTEAQQRRAEADVQQTQIQQLHAQIQQLQSRPKQGNAEVLDAVANEVEQLPTDRLKPKLIDRTIECERLRQEVAALQDALQAEQENHAKTRTSLTTALGDTVSLLSKGKVPEPSLIVPDFVPAISNSSDEIEIDLAELSKKLAPSPIPPVPKLPASES
jgi:DNA repair exonuclease SbcCD ATPase subunit